MITPTFYNRLQEKEVLRQALNSSRSELMIIGG